MVNPNNLENIAAHNQRSLKTLTRAIAMGKGKFSLIVLRCNYESLQAQILLLLHQQCSGEIETFVVPQSAVSLYQSIKEHLGDKSLDGLIVGGLESVKNLDFVLQSANRLRDKFRCFPFPIVLLLTDWGLKKLMQQAPDFNSFASPPIRFSLPDEELSALIFQRVDGAVNDADSFQVKGAEIEALRQDLAGRDYDFDGETQACFAFLDAWDLARNQQIDAAVAKYRECLEFWEEDKDVLRRGVVQLFIAQTYLQLKKPGFFKKPGFWEAGEKAKDYFSQSFKSFTEANRLDLKAKHIGKLAALLQQLEDWQSLEEIVTNEALPLHLEYGGFVAEDYGFLAVAAIKQSKWREAAESALEALEKEDNARYRSLYLLVLALAKLQLNEVENALDKLTEANDYLKAARGENSSEDDARLLVDIIEQLQHALFEKRQYLAAFNCKLTVRKIKSQYGWIAFIGAGRLQPSLKKTAGDILAASGRQPDLERLIERMKNVDKKLTVIYGQSGVGKSSLLQAGLVPLMQLESFDERDYLPVLLRRYKNWDRELIEELNCQSLEDGWQYFRQNEHFLIVLIFDQFEEFFFDNPDAGTRQEFYRFLRECLEVPYLKVVLSLREDYMHYFFELFRWYVSSGKNNGYEDIFCYLGDLKTEDARQIIESLTARSEIDLKPDLINQLVTDLAKELEGVRPIELQIVGSKLETDKITSLRAYKELGEKPKEILVERFLEDAVKDCGEENQRAAELVLFLLTTENTRPLKTKRELKEDLEVKEEKLDLVLEVLVGSGLVLEVPERPEDFYQLVHDYLVLFVRRKYEPQPLELLQEREERRRLEKENQKLLELQQEREKRKQLEKRLLVGSVAASVVMAVLTGISVIFGVQAYQRGQEAIKESSISSANESRLLNGPWEARLKALKAGRKLLNNNFRPTEHLSVVTDSLRQATYKKEGELFQESNRLVGDMDWNYGVSFSPDGKLIASVGWDKTVKLWNREGKLLQTWDAHRGLVRDVSFSPDGKTIATASYDNTVKLWSLDGEELSTLEGHQRPVIDVSFSSDGEIIATASRDYTVKLWNREGEELLTLEGHFGDVYGVSFSSDGELIASASFDNTVKLWRTSDGKELQTLWHEGKVYGVSFSPDGQLIASASWDNTVKLWSRDGKELRTLTGHQGPVIDVSFSGPDGELIASASGDNTVKLWSREGKLLQTLEGHKDYVNAASFSPDGKLIATASDDKTVKLWGREGKELQTLRGHKDYVNAASFSPDGKLIATASDDKTVKLWSRDGELYKFKEELTEDETFSVNALSVSFSPDGELIAAASYNNKVKRWSRDGNSLPFPTLVGHEILVRNVSFSPDAELIATASWDNTVKLWSRDGEDLQTLEGHQKAVIDVSFSLDGELIATASRDSTVKLWNRQGKELQTLRGHKGPVYGVSFSPNGELIATASWDNTVKLWSRDGEELSTLEGHFDKVYDVNFSPDGELIASASWDNTVKLWSGDGKLLQTLEEHDGPVISVSFSPDGKLIASTSADGTVILWDVWDFNELMKFNCQLLGDYLRNNPEVEESDRGLCDGFDVGE